MSNTLTSILIVVLILLTVGQFIYFRRRLRKIRSSLQVLKTEQKRSRKQHRNQLEAKLSEAKTEIPEAIEPLVAILHGWMSKNDISLFSCTLPSRIGHLALEHDLWIKERILTEEDRRPRILIACPDSAVNPHLLSYWTPHFDLVIPPAEWERFLVYFPKFKSLLVERHDYAWAIDETASCYQIYRQWGNRPPLLELRVEDIQFCKETLRKWGLKDGDWFVCIHNREWGYSPDDDHFHDFRNAPLKSIFPAIEEIVAKGGWVIRMGDPSMTPLPEMAQVIDYAHSPLKSARLDVVLCASARFFLGSSSGLYIVSTCFGVPAANANHAPMSILSSTGSDIGMPKLFYSNREHRTLSFREVMESPIANFRHADEFRDADVEVIDNTDDEILNLTREMLERISGECEYTEEDENLQHEFRSLFKPGHYGYGSAARTSRNFLRKHRQLLMSDDNRLLEEPSSDKK